MIRPVLFVGISILALTVCGCTDNNIDFPARELAKKPAATTQDSGTTPVVTQPQTERPTINCHDLTDLNTEMVQVTARSNNAILIQAPERITNRIPDNITLPGEYHGNRDNLPPENELCYFELSMRLKGEDSNYAKFGYEENKTVFINDSEEAVTDINKVEINPVDPPATCQEIPEDAKCFILKNN